MQNIEYTALNYYHSPISDECLCIGILCHNLTTGIRNFQFISNFKRFNSFDDEADVEFVKLYLSGIKEEVENNLFNYGSDFNIREYTKVYANEFRFSSVKLLEIEDDEEYVDNLVKIYMKYDLAKSKRLNTNEEKKMVRRVLKSNHLLYSTQKIMGPYNDDINFDYHVGDLCIKILSFKDKDLKRLINNARQWSFIAEEISEKNKVLFIYDSDNTEDAMNLEIIKNILSKNAKVLKFDQGIDYILKECA